MSKTFFQLLALSAVGTLTAAAAPAPIKFRVQEIDKSLKVGPYNYGFSTTRPALLMTSR